MNCALESERLDEFVESVYEIISLVQGHPFFQVITYE